MPLRRLWIVLLTCGLGCDAALPGADSAVDPAAAGLTFLPEADTYVEQSNPNTNYGKSTSLRVDSSPYRETLLRFATKGISSQVTSAKLRLYVPSNGTADGPQLFISLSKSWSESTVTYNTRISTLGSAFADKGPISAGGWAEYDLMPIFGNTTADVSFSLVMRPTSSDGVLFESREGAHPPQLVVVQAGAMADGSTAADLGASGDLASSQDLSSSSDLIALPDSSGGLDLTTARDLVAAPAPDLASSPDLSTGQGPRAPTHLIVIEQSKMSDAELVMLETLQGILAQTEPRIWIAGDSAASKALADLTTRHGVTTESASSAWDLVRRFASEVTGYILYDDPAASSQNVATSLAGPRRALAVASTIEAQAINQGLARTADVRGRDEKWALASFSGEFARGIFVEQQEASPFHKFLRDLAAARRAFVFYDGPTSTFRTTVAQTLGPDSVVFGWGVAERDWVRGLSAGKAAGCAADYSRNLSVLSAVREPDLTQRAHNLTPVKESGVHYVAFVMSDGDNIQWIGNNFGTDPRWWGSPSRGTFNMTWEMAPIFGEVAPSILRRFQLQASTTPGKRDFFVSGPSGHGYMFPSYYGDMTGYLARLGQLANATDIHIVSILNDAGSTGGMDACDAFLGRPEVDAVIYKDFYDYNAKRGQIRWASGKPCLSYRYLLWENGSAEDSPSGVATSLAARPRTPNVDAYSLVNVHAWSTWGGVGAMGAVEQTLSKLPPEVRLVTAEELFLLMKQ